IKQRIREVIKDSGLKMEEFSTKIGTHQSSLSRALSEGNNVGDATINKISLAFNVNKDWLISGKGMKYNANQKDLKAPERVMISYEGGVPFYEDIESSGGIIPQQMNNVETPTFYINYEHFNDCTAYLTHVGDSMSPKYCSGEIIAVKRIYNFDIILWGEAYLVITNDSANNLRTVKLLFQHRDDDKIVLRSCNPDYKGDTIIRKEDIISLFVIKGKITRNQL
ncbi:MAG: XRE family transcriptional regulator, partial [Bacteroidales bacterium]|nr:XRE family transcriptional regulator [Bacteroidales bacterium]